jgi:hypothetical protein
MREKMTSLSSWSAFQHRINCFLMVLAVLNDCLIVEGKKDETAKNPGLFRRL